jgi:predicted RNA-binding Zn ribbon-like protein
MAAYGKAPGELRLVQDFVNTLDVEDAEEGLATPDALRDWLAERELVDGAAALSAGDLERARNVREALRELMLANNDGRLESRAVDRLNREAVAASLQVRFDPDGRARLLAAAGGWEGALGRLLAVVERAMADGTWSRLKACREDTCRWAFYDRSRNRSGSWCNMEVCGNRSKARAYRAVSGGRPSKPVRRPDAVACRHGQALKTTNRRRRAGDGRRRRLRPQRLRANRRGPGP